MPRQMPFLPARAVPNNLLCGSFCVGTKQPWSVHSNICKQLLPLISTAMLSKHTFPLTATSALSCDQTPLSLICSPWDGSQAPGSLLCLSAQTMGIQLPAWTIPCSWEATGHMRACIKVQHSPLPEVTPKEQRAGWDHPPQVTHLLREGGEDTWVITSFGQKTRVSQKRYLMVTASRAQPRHAGRNRTTDSWKTSFEEGWGKSPLSPLVLTTGYFPLPQTIPGLPLTEAGCPGEQETGPSAGPRK